MGIDIKDYLKERTFPAELFFPNEQKNRSNKNFLEAISKGVIIDEEYFNPMFVYWVNIVQPIVAKNQPIFNLDKCFFDYIWYCWENKLDVVIKNTLSQEVIYSIASWHTFKYKDFDVMWANNHKIKLKKSENILNSLRLAITQMFPELPLISKNCEGDPYLPFKMSYGHYNNKFKHSRGVRTRIQIIDNFGSFTEIYGNGSLLEWVHKSGNVIYSFYELYMKSKDEKFKRGIRIYANTANKDLNLTGQKIFNNPLYYGCGAIIDINGKFSGFCIPKNV